MTLARFAEVGHEPGASAIVLRAPPLSTDVRKAVASAAGYADADKAASTKRAYERQFRQFAAWCLACGTPGMPSLPTTPEVVVAYLSAMADAGRKVSTIEQAAAAIAYTHEQAGFPWDKSPLILRKTRSGFRRKLGVAPKQKEPISTVHLGALVAACEGDELHALRDRALMLVGWVGAFRRSEIVALDVADVVFAEDESLRIILHRSKTDQEGKGFTKGLAASTDPALCPARALRAWLVAAKIREGAIFRSIRHGGALGGRLTAQSVALIVKTRSGAAGYDPRAFAGHSLRSGFVTAAVESDKPLDEIMRQTAHRRTDTLLGYIRHADVMKKNASSGLL